MTKQNMILCDGPWTFQDLLTMSKTKRGAASNYETLSNIDIINLPIKDIVADDAVCAIWVPSSLIEIGLSAMKNYGFIQKQTWIWAKSKKDPLINLKKSIKKEIKNNNYESIIDLIDTFDVNDILNFFMGRIFRQTHELVLIGTRGKANKYIENKAQRSVFIGKALKHSEKPEELQDRLELIFPKLDNRIEFFARRQRQGWLCLGNEAPMSSKEDIRTSIEKLLCLDEPQESELKQIISLYDNSKLGDLQDLWKKVLE
jgi:N6-adenosine-specific RNA methylase IME4